MKTIILILSSFLCISCQLRSGPELEDKLPPSNFLINGKADVLVYTGKSNWILEVQSILTILFSHGISYREVTAKELNEITLEELLQSKLLVMPGGDSDLISAGLYTETGINLREAIQEHGLNYLGFCAGAWLAVAPKPEPGLDPSYGLGLVDGPLLKKTYLQKQGLQYATPQITFADGIKRKQLWWGGPVTPDLPGSVYARFDDGTPAITQMYSGRGFVILSGVHPTATKAILNSIKSYEREAIAPDIAWKLIDSALNQKPLPTF